MTATLISPAHPCTCSDFDLPHQHCNLHMTTFVDLCPDCEEENRDTAPDEEDLCECGRKPEDCQTIDGLFSHGDREDPSVDYDLMAKCGDL